MDQEFFPTKVPRDNVITGGVYFHDSSSEITVYVSSPLGVLKNPVVGLVPLLVSH